MTKDLHDFLVKIQKDYETALLWGVEKEEYDLIPCQCRCHQSNGMMVHMVACCENGVIKIPKQKKENDKEV